MKIGKVSLFNEDCFEFFESCESASFDSVISSPPYKDEDVPIDYYAWLDKWVSEAKRVSRNSVFMLNSSTRITEICKRYSPDRLLVWYKGAATRYAYRFEPVFVFKTGEIKINKWIWSDTFKHAPINRWKNPYENPPELYRWLIRISGAKSVLEPCAGGGACGLAARALGVDWTGVEINPITFETLEKNFSQELLYSADEKD